MTKWVYTFGNGTAEGTAAMKNLLGGKGANLAEMSSLGLPVPPGFTLSTEVCNAYYDSGKSYPDDLKGQVDDAVAYVETVTNKKFGDPQDPLLVSVRSGARASMPGMMDTVLNLGLNDETVEGLAKATNNPRFAYDSYRRFIAMYSDVVLGLDHHDFESIIDDHKDKLDLYEDTELTADHWKVIVEEFKAFVVDNLDEPFPQDVKDQLWGAAGAVFSSWMNARAITYRALHDIPASWGTAVNIQAMVFGNLGEDSATGVAFTRNPSTGENSFYGEFLINAQGEDVVAGIRTPQNITEAARIEAGSDKPSLENAMPEAYAELQKIYLILEKHYKDMQDIEFTIERNKLWMLQTRNGKRTTKAALKIAVDMVAEDLITKQEAVMRIDPAALDQLLHPTLDPNAPRQIIGSGLPASPGAACGEIALTSEEAERISQAGRTAILVRVETSPEDINGMIAAAGILTARGGMTSHAAVVARGMGRPCVSGAGALKIDMVGQTINANGLSLKVGDIITIDGSTGEIIKGEVATIQPELSGDFAQIMEWADEARHMRIRTNADTPRDAKTAREFGAEGIGLCRTEHMFFDEERITVMREMIIAQNGDDRRKALAKLLPMQKSDFAALFEIMSGLPVTIRLLDPPLHEFLPHGENEMVEVAKAMDVNVSTLRERVIALTEANPMLGHRGCRLAISYPEIPAMQTRAIIEAAIEAAEKTGEKVIPEIMVPLVSSKAELDAVKAHINAAAKDVMEKAGILIDYTVGTMIELPRAALRAADIAQSADFFSFGTNDLTQTTFGISRDDSAGFLENYQKLGVLEHDPFQTIDVDGVGELVEIAVQRGKGVKPDIKLGICGEHGGDPKSVDFCHKTGLDYVSCSPFRVPIARLAAAQASIHQK